MEPSVLNIVYVWMTVKLEYHLPNLHLLPPNDGPQTGPKHVEAWSFNKVKTNSASCWFVTQKYSLCGCAVLALLPTAW
jgi:hypothetical protein